MYAVVGCSDCSALWVVADDPETTECPRCGTRHTFDRLKRFFEGEDPESAREARAALLADRADAGDAFASGAAFAEMTDAADAEVVDEAERLAAAGIDPEAVAAAGERASGGDQSSESGGGTRREVVLAAVEALDAPTAGDVADRVAERGVGPEAAREALEKLVRAGEVSESRGVYRRV
ncbi:MAG: DUF5817 domain-containing protein [Halobacteriaceae archaeon]